jgi:dCMP deaminase
MNDAHDNALDDRAMLARFVRTDGSVQPTAEQVFFAIAAVLAEQSSCPDGARHGCVITVDDQVISVGWGTPPTPCTECWLRKKFAETGIKDFSVCPSRHAEEQAVAWLPQGQSSAWGATAWVTREPCEKCRRLLTSVGIADIRWP